MKKYAFGALWVGLIAQVAWMTGDGLAWHAPGNKFAYDLALVVLFTAFAASYGRWRWLSALIRALVALEFVLSVSDRFGLLGMPGTPGVSWGDWGNFVRYTHIVNAFLPASFAPALAVLATIAEVVLGGALLVGVRIRLAAMGAAALTLTYAAAMSLSLLVVSQFQYAVLVIAAGSFALAMVDASPISADSIVARWRQRNSSMPPSPYTSNA